MSADEPRDAEVCPICQGNGWYTEDSCDPDGDEACDSTCECPAGDVFRPWEALFGPIGKESA